MAGDTCRKAQKSFVFSILADSATFATLLICSRFFARYRGIDMQKRYKTVVRKTALFGAHCKVNSAMYAFAFILILADLSQT